MGDADIQIYAQILSGRAFHMLIAGPCVTFYYCEINPCDNVPQPSQIIICTNFSSDVQILCLIVLMRWLV
jgi:hypothetical protein